MFATIVSALGTTGEPGDLPQRELRPLGVGEVLNTAIRLYTRNATTMWKIVAAVTVPLVVLQEIVVSGSVPAGAFVHDGALYTPTGSLGISAAEVIARIVLGLIALLVINGALALCLIDSYAGHPLSWSRSLRAATSRVRDLLWLAILYGIVITIAFVLAILPGIWLSVALSVAVPALMFEGIGAVPALRRSSALVRHRWWATFAALVVATIMLVVVLFVIGLIIGVIESALSSSSIAVWLAFRGLSSVLADLIAYPFIGAVIAVIYIDLRVRKEALDLELLTAGDAPLGAAGVPGRDAGARPAG